MSFTRAYTQRELDFIRANWQGKTAKEIASELGRSERGIYKKIRDMHLRDGDAGRHAPPMQSGPKSDIPMQSQGAQGVPPVHREAMNDHDRLAGLRDLIWAALLEAGPADVARLAPEYRRTIEEMERMDAGEGEQAREDAEGAGPGLAEIISL